MTELLLPKSQNSVDPASISAYNPTHNNSTCTMNITRKIRIIIVSNYILWFDVKAIQDV